MHLPGCLEPRQRAGGLHAVAGLAAKDCGRNPGGSWENHGKTMGNLEFWRISVIVDVDAMFQGFWK